MLKMNSGEIYGMKISSLGHVSQTTAVFTFYESER